MGIVLVGWAASQRLTRLRKVRRRRRGYGTLVSHSVPPYARAGLYSTLASTRELLGDYLGDIRRDAELRAPIADAIGAAGLYADLPAPRFVGADSNGALSGDDWPRGEELTEEWVACFDGYAREAYDYLGVLRDRLFSEGVVIRNLDNEPCVLRAPMIRDLDNEP